MRALPARLVVVGGAIAAVLVALASLAFGVYPVTLGEIGQALAGLFGGGDGGAPTSAMVVLDIRLARAVAALCVGAGLGTAGAVLQALLRNPLASPFVVGTAQGAGFGAVLAIFLGLSYAGTVSLAFGMAVLATLLVLALARTQRSLPTESVVLTGLAVSLLFGSLIGLVRFLSHDEGVTGRIAIWLLGGLYQVTWGPLTVMGTTTVVAVVAACFLWRRLDLLALGEEDAARLGLRTATTGTLVLLLACVMTSLAVCIGGVIAFVGLIVPHAARRLVGPAHSALLPASALLGGILVVVTDTLARSAAPPQELPLGVVTSIIGVPAFLAIMRSMRVRRTGL